MIHDEFEGAGNSLGELSLAAVTARALAKIARWPRSGTAGPERTKALMRLEAEAPTLDAAAVAGEDAARPEPARGERVLAPRRSRQEWEIIFHEWRDGTEKLKDFCAARGLKYASVHNRFWILFEISLRRGRPA